MMKNHFLANGKRMKDWERTWRNWLMRDESNESNKRPGAHPVSRPATSDSRVSQAEAAKASLAARGYVTGGQLALESGR